jgi:hypothetical protein
MSQEPLTPMQTAFSYLVLFVFTFGWAFVKTWAVSRLIRWLFIKSNPAMRVRAAVVAAIGTLLIFAGLWTIDETHPLGLSELGILFGIAINFVFDLAVAKYPQEKSQAATPTP